ncbi:hypothetical protein BP00DRAFT_101395 [Aspergillus indologenus CBS 114.80]|uniref:Uncharacterized protein n=1 Tax=Aspergillus indologenus CBS 114.80 TaxID=1450541 RepID=A0A2V5IA81_9EURO|nr:hypothetical protein BP00DRAFT_101395 [Aspergillus indologenus CBS 114.80]
MYLPGGDWSEEICDLAKGEWIENSDIDLECIILIVQLVFNQMLPPPELRDSIADIFGTLGGKDLQNHLEMQGHLIRFDLLETCDPKHSLSMRGRRFAG